MMQISVDVQEGVDLVCIGSVEDVAYGVFGEAARQRWIDASLYRYGFLAGSPEGADSLGEMILIEGTCYCHSTRDHTLISGPKFVSSAALLVPNDVEASGRVTYRGSPIELDALYSQIYGQLQMPFVVGGNIAYLSLVGQSIAIPPIHGVNALDHLDEFFPDPPVELTDGKAGVVGCVYPSNEAPVEVFIPSDSPLQTHTHALADSVRHVLPGTTVTEASLDVYLIATLSSQPLPL